MSVTFFFHVAFFLALVSIFAKQQSFGAILDLVLLASRSHSCLDIFSHRISTQNWLIFSRLAGDLAAARKSGPGTGGGQATGHADLFIVQFCSFQFFDHFFQLMFSYMFSYVFNFA